jgi:Learning-associated protein
MSMTFITVANSKAVVEAVKARRTEDDSMDVEIQKKYNKRTMKDEFGNYPPWYNKRKVKELQLKNQKIKKKKATGKKKASGKGRHR